MVKNLIEVNDLVKHFPVTKGVIFKKAIAQVKATDGVSFSVKPNETFGLAGESGSGKTTTARIIAGLMSPTSGSISFDGDDISSLDTSEMLNVRKKIGMVFQDPYSSLNPRKTIRQIVETPLLTHGYPKEKIYDRVTELITQVGLNDEHAERYPHMFSGGQRQRIAIARALALNPQLIIADEPVSALDVSIQSQIINLLTDLRSKYGMALLFISHDLNVMRYICDNIAVMYLGKIVEVAPSEELFSNPKHPYTKALIASTPIPDPEYMAKNDIVLLEGSIPSPINVPSGCRFHSRCPLAKEKGMPKECTTIEPDLSKISSKQYVSCHFAK